MAKRVIRMKLIGVVFIACCSVFVFGCAGKPGEMLGPVPTKSEKFKADYAKLAECSLMGINAALGPGTMKTDLPNAGTIKLTLVSGGVQYYEATFIRIDANETKVEITAAQTMWGPFPVTDKVYAAIATCATG
jgi:hypothetical protein